MVTPDDNPVPADILADMQAVVGALAAGNNLAPDIAQRIRERSNKAQAEILRKHGMREIAVDLIREIRDQE